MFLTINWKYWNRNNLYTNRKAPNLSAIQLEKNLFLGKNLWDQITLKWIWDVRKAKCIASWIQISFHIIMKQCCVNIQSSLIQDVTVEAPDVFFLSRNTFRWFYWSTRLVLWPLNYWTWPGPGLGSSLQSAPHKILISGVYCLIEQPASRATLCVSTSETFIILSRGRPGTCRVWAGCTTLHRSLQPS